MTERRSALRFGPAVLTIGMLAATWFGAGALSSSNAAHLVVPKGASAVPGGYLYVARPGDSIWSIASAMEPNADPRQLVDELDAQVPGGVLRAGETLRLP